MKVLFLCPDLGIPVLGRKGASIHVRGLAEAFGRAGHEVVVASPLLEKSPWEPPAELGVRLLHLPLGEPAAEAGLSVKAFCETVGVESSLPGELRRILWDQEAAVKLKRRFEGDPPDVVYERVSLYATAGAFVARALGRPHVLELNAPLAQEQSTYRATGLGDLAARSERWLLRRADAVVAVSEPLREYAMSLGVEAERVHVMPNGVDPTRFHPGPPDPELRRRLGLGEGPVLGFAGGLRPWHGARTLPALAARLAGDHPGLRLLVMGDGPLRPAIEAEAARLGVADRVVLAGSVAHERIPALLRQVDVALAPYDPLDHAFYFSPLKLFEYMACGVPVVAAALGQIPAVLGDGDAAAGLTYPAGDLDALAAACRRLLADPAARSALGRAGAERAARAHTWDRNAEGVADIVRRLGTRS